MAACPAPPAMIAKLPLVDPGAIVTELGTVAAPVLLLESETTAPAAGAMLLSVTVPLRAAPAGAVEELRVTAETVGPFTYTALPSTFNSATTAHGLPFTSLVAWKRT